MFFKKKKIKKQQALFAEAIREAGYADAGDGIIINHEKPACYYRNEEFDITFPLRFLREARTLDYTKKYDFCFRGIHTPKRDWVKAFESSSSSIRFTDHGRKIAKDTFDRDYYQEMASSRFTLCPPGDFKWTYRFLEAALCYSIPVIERGMEHPQCDGFVFLYSDMKKEELLKSWNEEAVARNYKLFLSRHTLLERFVFLDSLYADK